MPSEAIFADTQDEPPEVYDYLEYLKPLLPFPIVTVTAGRLSDTFGEKFVHIPAYMRNKDGESSMGKKQCTRHFKLNPIYRRLRKQLGAHHKRPITVWVGISTDEISRVKPARVKYVVNRWPLIEKEWSRNACSEWLKRNGFKQPPKSACEFCPLHSDFVWRGLSKASMDRAIAVDKLLATRGEYLHPSLVRLEDVDFSTEEERGQLNMFNNECEGMCGV